MSDAPDERQRLRSLIKQWESGAMPPRDVFASAKAMWLEKRWPRFGEPGYDGVAQFVAWALADARQLGVSHEDFPILLELLDSEMDEAAMQARFMRHVASVDATAREALQRDDDYYGPRDDPSNELDLEMAYPDPAYRRLHKGVREDPESVWDDLRAELCGSGDPFDDRRVDLLEDLVFHHAEAFIDRIEALADECDGARGTIAWAQVGGSAGPAIERFDALQQRLLKELEREGKIELG